MRYAAFRERQEEFAGILLTAEEVANEISPRMHTTNGGLTGGKTGQTLQS